MSLTPSDRRRRTRTRAALGVVILVAWAAALGGLVQRDVVRSGAQRLADLALRVNPGNVFFAVEQDGKHIGWASSTIDTLPDTLIVRDALVADVAARGASQRTVARTSIVMSRLFALRSFIVEVGAANAPTKISGHVLGDTGIAYVVENGGVPGDTQRVRVAGPVLLPSLVPLAAMLGDKPKIGRRISYSTFDPATLTAKTVAMVIQAESLFVVEDSARKDVVTGRWVSVLQDTVRAWRLAVADGQGVSSWVDGQGRVVETTALSGLRVHRMAYELSFENWRLEAIADSARATGGKAKRELPAPTAGEVLASTAIASGIRGPTRELTSLRIRVAAPSLAHLDVRGGRQTLDGDVITVSREPDSLLTPSYTPAMRDDFQSGFHARFSEQLRSEPGIDVGRRAILEQAAKITSGHRTKPREMAALLVRWVHDSLAKVSASSTTDALTVLQTRRGDCNEHTQLFAALARAVLIPTRVTAGLAYLNGKFYYHAWPEVYLGDWVAVDPTWGQFPADAAHIRLVTGGVPRQAELLKLIGPLHIEVLDAR